MTKTLLEIRNAEEKARKALKTAEKEKISLISKSREELVGDFSKAMEAMEATKNNALNKKSEELVKQRQEILNNAKNEVARLQKQALKNRKKAVDYILKRLEDTILK